MFVFEDQARCVEESQGLQDGVGVRRQLAGGQRGREIVSLVSQVIKH